MSRLITVDHHVIYMNPHPPRVSEYVVFPYLAVLPDDSLVCACRHGTARESGDGVVRIQRSTDGGVHWRDEGAICDRVQGVEGAQGPSGLVVMPDGELLGGITVRRQVGEDSTPLIARSRDGGKTWSPPELLNVEPCGKVGGRSACESLY